MTNRAYPPKRTLGYLSGSPRVSTDPEAEAGGPRSHVIGVIRAFEELGWSVKPFIVGDRIPRSFPKRNAQQVIGNNSVRLFAADIARLILGWINSFRAWRELGGQVDLIYERFAALQSLGWLFKKHGVFWILETNGPFFYEAKVERKSLILSNLARSLEIKAYRDCDLLICVTETLKEMVIREANIPADKILVLPNGVDTDFFDPGKHQTLRLFKGFTVGYVGIIFARQGLNLLIQAVAELEQEKLDISLVIVGSGSELSNLKEQCISVGLQHKVKFVGQVSRDQVPNYIAGFDVGYSGQIPLQIGQMYHSPLKLYEYMAMGKPVIASSFEDAKRTISHGKFGCLFKPGNKDDLKQALRLAYEKRHTLISIKDEIRNEIVMNHNWGQRVTQLISAVEEKIGHSVPKANSRR